LSIEERHPFHQTIVKNIGEVLSAIKTRLDGEAAESKRSAQETAAACERNADVQTAAGAAHEAAVTAVQEQTAATSRAVDDFDECERVRADAQDKVWAAEVEKLRMQNQREKWTDCKPWKALMELEASVSEKQVNKLHDQLAKILKGLGAEQTLLVAVESALKKPSGERGEFDHQTLRWIQDLFDKELAKVDAEIKEDEALEATAQEAMAAAAAVLEGKQTVRTGEEEKLSQLQSVAEEKSAALREAKQEVKAGQKAHVKFEKKISDAEEELAAHATVLESFEFLAVRSSAPPPASPSPPPAEGGAAAADEEAAVLDA